MAEQTTGFGRLLEQDVGTVPWGTSTPATQSYGLGDFFDDSFGLTTPQTDPIDFEKELADIEAYIEKLLSVAQGDKDIAIKRLDAEHLRALGTNDTKRASFFEKVADKLEEEIGVIPYDYMIKSERIEQDKTSALQRLDEDEQTLRGELTKDADRARESQGETLSQRGILSAPRAEVGGLAGQEVSDLETEIQEKFDAISREVGRETEDIGRTSGRNLADLSTLARRAGAETKIGVTEGREDIERTLMKKKELLDRERELEKSALEEERKAFN